MAGYRQIHTQFWKDEYIIDLEPPEKLLFIYLFSNDQASIGGLYKLPVRVMANETGLDRKTIEAALAKFDRDGKIFYRDGVVLVVNMMRYHANRSITTQKRIIADAQKIPDCELKSLFLKTLDTASIPHRYHTDTKTLTADKEESESESESKEESEEEEEVQNPLAPDDAVEIYHSVAGVLPNDVQQDRIYDTVTNPTLWRSTVGHWSGHGWKIGNVEGMLDLYNKGGPEFCRCKQNGNGPPGKPATKRRAPSDDELRAQGYTIR